MRVSRRGFIAGTATAALFRIAVPQDAVAGDVERELLAEEDRIRVKEAVRTALGRMRLTMALGRPLKFPFAMKVAGIADLDPREAAKLRVLVDAGILRTAPSSGAAGYIVFEEARRSLDYDPKTGIFRSVGRRLLQLIEARYIGGPDGCRCLVTSVPDWADGMAPGWAQQIVASRAFPEFEGLGAHEDTLFFQRRQGDWFPAEAPARRRETGS
jgi:hypothetical protein